MGVATGRFASGGYGRRECVARHHCIRIFISPARLRGRPGFARPDSACASFDVLAPNEDTPGAWERKSYARSCGSPEVILGKGGESMSRNVISILVFIVILVVLNFIFKDAGSGIHISIIGSVVLTLIIWFVMAAFSKASSRRRR